MKQKEKISIIVVPGLKFGSYSVDTSGRNSQGGSHLEQ